MTIHKTFEIKVLDKRKDGGRIIINTASKDRDNDHVLPSGANMDNYLKNPVVMFGHNYRDYWSTVGKSNVLEKTADGIIADFTLRPAANDLDPQNVIRLLWEGEWIRTASIGFIPISGKPNTVGGTDFTEWELLEWSLVPIPSNQDALRLAVKAFGESQDASDVFATTAAHVIVDKSLDDAEREKTLQQLETWRGKFGQSLNVDEALDKGKRETGAWIRRLSVESDMGAQTLFAMFREYVFDVPEDATMLQFDWVMGECNEVPHPEAGKTVTFKDALFVPPIAFVGDGFGEDAVHGVSARSKPDDQMVAAPHSEWKVTELSEIIDSLPAQKSFKLRSPGFGIDTLTKSGIANARKAVHAQIKRGRVLSAKNEGKIIQARDNLNDVLAQLDEQPEGDTEDTGKKTQHPESLMLDPEQEKELLQGLKHITTLVKEVLS